MGRRAGGSENLKRLAMERLARTEGLRDCQIALAVLLPLFGMNLQDTAVVIGMSKGWVAKQRAKAVRADEPPKVPPHGGRRLKLFKSLEDEKEFLKREIPRAMNKGRERSGRLAAL